MIANEVCRCVAMKGGIPVEEMVMCILNPGEKMCSRLMDGEKLHSEELFPGPDLSVQLTFGLGMIVRRQAKRSP